MSLLLLRRARGEFANVKFPSIPQVVGIEITSQEPPNFAPPNTYQLTVNIVGKAWVVDADGATRIDRVLLTGRTVTYSSSSPSVATISASGLVTAVGNGTTSVRATCEGISTIDGVTVVVTTPINPVASVSVSPTSASVSVGNIVTLRATVKDASSNVLQGKTVTWGTSASSKASIGADSGTETHQVSVTGVATGGSPVITATCETVNSPTVAITVVVAGGQFPNKPAGMTTLFDWAVTGVPTADGGFTGNGITIGSAYVYHKTTTPATYAAQPSPYYKADPDGLMGSCLAFRYAVGLIGGQSPGRYGSVFPGQYSEIYEALDFKLGHAGGTWQFPGTGTKLFGYWGVGGYASAVYMLCTNNGSAGDFSTFKVGLRTQGHMSSTDNQADATNNVTQQGKDFRFTVGVKYRVETYMKLGTLDGYDGLWKMWVDGLQIYNVNHMRFIVSGFSTGFFEKHHDPIWGGGGGTVAVDQYAYFENIHCAGIL